MKKILLMCYILFAIGSAAAQQNNSYTAFDEFLSNKAPQQTTLITSSNITTTNSIATCETGCFNSYVGCLDIAGNDQFKREACRNIFNRCLNHCNCPHD